MRAAAFSVVVAVVSLVAGGSLVARPAQTDGQAGAAAWGGALQEASEPDDEAPGAGSSTAWSVRPYAIVVGGLQYEWPQDVEGTRFPNDPEGDTVDLAAPRNGRVVTLALSRFGLMADWGEHVHLESEIEVNAGAYGTSVWEGQAALQVNNQLLRLMWWGLTVEVGRLLDPASVDFMSDHVGDQLLMDKYTRVPLLEAGYNRGQGVRLAYEALPGLSVGATFNAATPLSTTGGYLIAGKYSDGKFSRFYRLAGEQIVTSPFRYPADNTHLMILTPSVTYRHRWLEVQGAAQVLWANVDVNKTSDDVIFGYNLRLGVRGHALDDLLVPFANFSYVTHNILNYQATDQTERNKTWDGQDWETFVVTAGLDLNLWGRSGFGLQYSLVKSRQGDGDLVDGTQHYASVAGTWWITETIALGARVSLWMSEFDDQVFESSQWFDQHLERGDRSFYLTLRKDL